MLERVCLYLHNFFVQSVHTGDYSIANGAVSISFLKEGQRFWIHGSSLNDGIYTWHADGIKDADDAGEAGISDEDFNGDVCALAVPSSLLALVSEMRAWEAAHSDAINSPYQSESVIGVYSYTKASGSGDGSTGDPVLDQFRGRLAPWRRTSL